MNKVILIGRLTKDPDLRFAAGSGTAVARFNLAVTRPFKKDETDFISCVAWNGAADALSKYTSKGSLIGITGRIQTRNYESNGKKVHVTEVIANEVTFLEPKKQDTVYRQPTNQQPVQQPQYQQQTFPYTEGGNFGETIDIQSDDFPF